jgi:DNA helicase-2/ATP-dependent DNA helicase PcrA
MTFPLNDKQLEAVRATEGPVLVIAGAGSGKTRVLTERIAHLVVEKGVRPHEILAFTFTNRAAREMKERLEKSNPGITERLWVGTFHATGVRILRAEGEKIGIQKRFSIYDANDSADLVKEILSRQVVLGGMMGSPSAIRDRISRWKNDLMTPEMAAEGASDNIEKKVASAYREYERGLRRANALDFDDLIAKVVELFSVHPDVKERYARRFRYILVDEFQDTNPIQMALIDALASHHNNLFAVGDDDQSIYSWRGARVDHILNFEELYPGTKVVRLEQNYRSTQTILDAANYVIAHNKGRKGKNLWTDLGTGERAGLLVSMDEETEAINVLDAVKSLVAAGYSPREIAVLYRTNAQSRALEDVFKLGSVPYQIIGGVRFYERMEVRDILAYCKLLANPSDDVSFKRIVNVPPRGLGKSTYESLSSIARSNDTPVLDALKSGAHFLATAQKKRVAAFLGLFSKLRDTAKESPAPRVVEAIITETDYKEYLRQNYPDADARIENVEEVVAAAEVYTQGRDDPSLAAFLEEIALVADVDALDEIKGQVTLMTLHNAKGLEYDCVIIAGLEDGLVPHYNSLDTIEELEEERRLFYVGMTRARKKLFFSYANLRRRMGVVEGGAPSRFLAEVPAECIEGTEELARGGSSGGDFDDLLLPFKGTRGAIPAGRSAPTEYEDYSQEEVAYAVGMRILHNDFGRGVVRKVEGSGENLRVTVIFDGGGERKFLAHYAPMRPLV